MTAMAEKALLQIIPFLIYLTDSEIIHYNYIGPITLEQVIPVVLRVPSNTSTGNGLSLFETG